MTPISLLLLYLSFRLKQLTCDFLLQTDRMALTKGQAGAQGIKALLSHTLIHAIGTLIIALVFVPFLWWLALVDFAVHSFVDRVKASITYKKGWKPSDTAFWWAFGFDQEAHNLTHLAYIVIIVMHLGGISL